MWGWAKRSDSEHNSGAKRSQTGAVSGANRPKQCEAPKQPSTASELFLASYDLTPGPSPEGEGSSFAGILVDFDLDDFWDRTQRSADYDLSAAAKTGRRGLTQKGGVWEMEETPNRPQMHLSASKQKGRQPHRLPAFFVFPFTTCSAFLSEFGQKPNSPFTIHHLPAAASHQVWQAGSQFERKRTEAYTAFIYIEAT